ncbi:hypothetical protein [Halohasta salina]|uniref:hypothetical protein n=1 Tax=Halohasta salina TaxID=2961621 RepID=UPI0020A50F8C|nr:hypothetical protein [Halohasta salina]
MRTDRPVSWWLLRVVVVGIVAGGIVGVAAGTADASDPPIQIETNVTPEEPVVGEDVSIEATISNLEHDEGRNVDVRYVYLREAGTLNDYDRFRRVGTVGSGGSLSIPLSVTFDDPGQKRLEVEITTQYSDEDGEIYTYRQPVFVDVQESELHGEVRLTSVEAVGGSAVTIEGDAANIGNTDVESVLLSVPDTGNVSPRSPNGEYFVGGVDASEFATFDLTADADPEAESVPVEITYIVDGERMTKTQQVDLGSANRSAPAPSTQAAASHSPPAAGPPASGPPLVPIGIAVGLLVVGGIGIALWRRQ